MPMYDLIEYSNNHSKLSGKLWQYYKDKPGLTDPCGVANNSASFKFKLKITGKTAAGATKNVEIMMAFKYLNNFCRTLQMHLINCELNLILTLSDKCVLSNDTKATIFTITDTNIYVPAVTYVGYVSTQDNAKLLHLLKPGFKRTINWNKYQSKVTIEVPNPYLDYLTDPSFQEVYAFFILSFENTTDRTVHTKYDFPPVEIQDYNVMINGENFFDQPVRNNLRTYNI